MLTTVFIDSCSHLPAAEVTDKYQGTASTVASLGTDRYGIGSSYVSALTLGNITFLPWSAAAAAMLSCDFRPTGYDGRVLGMSLTSGLSPQLTLHYTNAGTLQIRRPNNSNETSSTVLAETTRRFKQGRWYHIEWAAFMSDTVGTSELRVDGQVELSVSGVDTSLQSTQQVQTFYVGGRLSAFGEFSSIVFRLGASYSSSDFRGDVRVGAYWPDGDGNYSSSFTALGGGAHYLEVDEVLADDDTSYDEAAGTNQRASYTIEAVDSGYTLGAVQVNPRNRAQGSAFVFEPFLRIGGVDYDYGAAVLSSSVYLSQPALWPLSPATAAAFTEAEFNGLEAGVLSN